MEKRETHPKQTTYKRYLLACFTLFPLVIGLDFFIFETLRPFQTATLARCILLSGLVGFLIHMATINPLLRQAASAEMHAASFFLMAAIGVQFGVTQQNVIGYFETVTTANNFDQIRHETAAGYYHIEGLRIQQGRRHMLFSQRTLGKYAADLELKVNFSLPIGSSKGRSHIIFCEDLTETSINYKKKSVLEMGRIQKRFQKKAESKKFFFDGDSVQLKVVEHPRDLRLYKKTIQLSKDYRNRPNLVFLEKPSTPYGNRFGKTVWPLVIANISIPLAILLFIMRVRIIPSEYDTKRPVRELIEFGNEFLFHRAHGGAYLIGYACLLVYIFTLLIGFDVVSPSVSDFIDFGGVSRSLVAQGRYWRYGTHLFTHAGLLHIAHNMVFLALISWFFERHVNSLVFVFSFLVSGILAAVISLHYNEEMVLVGASNGILGLTGMYLASLMSKKMDTATKIAGAIIFGINLAFTFLAGSAANIDHTGHMAGLVIGCVLGMLHLPLLREKPHPAVTESTD